MRENKVSKAQGVDHEKMIHTLYLKRGVKT